MDARALSAEVKDFCRDEDASPRSSCSTAWSSTKPSNVSISDATSCGSLSPCSRISGIEDDSKGEVEEEEEGEVAAVHKHLKSMNAASDEVNAVQQEIAAHQKEKAVLERLWAVGSARLARSVGFTRLWKLKSTQTKQKRQLAKEAAVEASSRYFTAVAVGAEPEELERLAQQHAECLAQYRVAAPTSSSSGSAPQPSKPFIDAEDEHRRHIDEIDESMEQLTKQLSVAKSRYQAAMGSLQELSEQIHRRRASSSC